jgi:hypothetical protein
VIKMLIVFALFIVLGSLFSALYFLVRDQGKSGRVVNALLIRVSVSVVLMIAIMTLVYFGVIQPNPRPY